MNLEIYISPNLYYKNNKLYYNLNNKIIKLNNNNWHKYLEEYGYNKLELGWKKRLKSTQSKNSLWGVIDCGSDGDCLFLCIEEALKNINEPLNDKYSVNNLRNFISKQINDNNFDIILENYKLEFDNNEFIGLWDPYKIKNKEDLKKEIRKTGDSFWGDHILIQLLEDSLNINIFLLNNENDYFDEINKTYKIQTTGKIYDKNKKNIILLYCNNSHFQLIGYFNKEKIQNIFTYEELPSEFLKILKEDNILFKK